MTTVSLLLLAAALPLADEPANVRKPVGDDDLRYWLGNMVWHHRFTLDEVRAATGLGDAEVTAALKRFGIAADTRPKRAADAPLLVLPYPGGRHPRIGFLDGALRPQRETKVSVFTPWDDASYVVVDVPEAIWSNLGLTYLAHTHIDTVWTKQGVALPPLEWNRRADGSLDVERKLPNGVAFGAKVVPGKDAVRMDLWLTNGTKETLTDLRVQVCAMLKGAAGFNQQVGDNKVSSKPYTACRSADGKRWVITAWEPCHRVWNNPPCPCLHSDPKFADCPPGQTKRLRGWLSFYEGDDVEAEFRRIDKLGWQAALEEPKKTRVRGTVIDADSGKALPCRLYLDGDDGSRWTVQSDGGTAVPYRKQNAQNKDANETHTALSAHPFVVELPPGRYTLTVERGKEYHPLTRQVTVEGQPLDLELKLSRWIDLAGRGWYSGDTHVHRTLAELPTAMLADDVNVAFPLLYWVRDAFAVPNKPSEPDPGPKAIAVDPTHVIYPRNTEIEIFNVEQKRHTLGAFFALNHRTVFEAGAPPVRGLGRKVHAEGGLIELDKHNWPWSMAIVPLMPVDLYELTNNHVWRAAFAFTNFGEAEADYMKVERTDKGWTEWGWIDYGLQNYYALLNCGFRLRPTAGTASGVHPVPLGFGRVYVHLPDGFGYDAWVKALDQGRSFVTTGPMLFVTVNGQGPGHTFRRAEPGDYRVAGSAVSGQPLGRIEVVVNGEVVRTLKPDNRPTQAAAFESAIDATVRLDGSSWVAVRCFEDRADKRVRFAHTGPVHVEMADKPLRPRRAEVDYLIKRVKDELARSAAVLPAAALDEYRDALRAYEEVARNAR